MNKKILYELKEKHEKDATRRSIAASISIAVVIFILLVITKHPKDTEELIMMIISSLVLALVDIFIHFIIFSFTIMKNYEESIKLEELEKELNR